MKQKYRLKALEKIATFFFFVISNHKCLFLFSVFFYFKMNQKTDRTRFYFFEWDFFITSLPKAFKWGQHNVPSRTCMQTKKNGKKGEKGATVIHPSNKGKRGEMKTESRERK